MFEKFKRWLRKDDGPKFKCAFAGRTGAAVCTSGKNAKPSKDCPEACEECRDRHALLLSDGGFI